MNMSILKIHLFEIECKLGMILTHTNSNKLCLIYCTFPLVLFHNLKQQLNAFNRALTSLWVVNLHLNVEDDLQNSTTFTLRLSLRMNKFQKYHEKMTLYLNTSRSPIIVSTLLDELSCCCRL